MDPLHPIAPGPPPIATPPVERLERITRERDRPTRDESQRERRRARDRTDRSEGDAEHGEPRDDGEHPHIDVRV